MDEGRGLARFEHGLRSGENDPVEIAALRDSGVFWPGEFACPVLLAEFAPVDHPADLTSTPRFLGTATMIGGDMFLSARHVFLDAAGTPLHSVERSSVAGVCRATRPALALLRVEENPHIAIAAIEWIEAHPDRQCDLVVGKLIEWNADYPWDAVGQPAPLHDVLAVGYPYDRMAVLNTGDLSSFDTAFNSPRYLKGYVTRGTDLDHDPWMPRMSFEVSFPLNPGMSGSPIWHASPAGERVLFGIATGSLSQTLPRDRSTRIDPDGTQVVTETMRVDEYGLGVRLSAVLHWQVMQAEGRQLIELMRRPEPDVRESPSEHGPTRWMRGRRFLRRRH